jgi:hypothetical protein
MIQWKLTKQVMMDQKNMMKIPIILMMKMLVGKFVEIFEDLSEQIPLLIRRISAAQKTKYMKVLEQTFLFFLLRWLRKDYLYNGFEMSILLF